MLLSPATAEPAHTASIEPTFQDNESATKKGNSKESRDQWGEITIAQPKIWQYERVTALLDGLLRDVEGVSLEDLTRLNPSSQNAAAVKFIQSALGVSVTFDQAALVNNRNTQQNFELQRDSQRQQLDRYSEYLQSLTAERNRLAGQLFAAQTVVDTLQPLKDAGQITPQQQIQLTAAQTRAAGAQTELVAVNKLISDAGSPPALSAPPNLQGTAAQALSATSMSGFADVLKSLPDGVQKNLTSALQSPTYPATKQLDNFITLLHERLAREISVLQDDLTRDPSRLVYLVEFDVGLYPSDKTKNHMARVEFEMKGCKGCKIYSLYPGQSSYNVANYQGSSRRKTFIGNFLSLIGLGISASYQRQEDALQGSLVQSVYISGFQDDAEGDDPTAEGGRINQRFGWYYNAAPFDQYVTPGIRTTFAIVTVPRDSVVGRQAQSGFPPTCEGIRNIQPRTEPAISLCVNANWVKRDSPLYQKSHWYSKTYLRNGPYSTNYKSIRLPLPETEGLRTPPVKGEADRIHVLRMEYNPVYYNKDDWALGAAFGHPLSLVAPSAPISAPAQSSIQRNGCRKDECASVLLTLDVPVDPNLVVSVRGTPLRRVRDWRGRATSVLPPAQSGSDLPPPTGASGIQIKGQNPASRSLLESDQSEPDSWFAVSSHGLLLNISRDLAGEEEFPSVQISDPARHTLVIPYDLRQNYTEIITNGFRFLPSSQMARHVEVNFLKREPRTSVEKDGARWLGGPYPPATYLPLFLPHPPHKKFYSFVGQTGEDLLIGFLKDAEYESDYNELGTYSAWLDLRTQVVLEDPRLDLAWSLTCRSQGRVEIVCKLPMSSLFESYMKVLDICWIRDSCPQIERHIRPLRESFKPEAERLAQDAANELFEKGQSEMDWAHLPRQEKEEAARLKLGEAVSGQPKNGPFLPDLHVWVEQHDPAGRSYFDSFAPVVIGLFPIPPRQAQDSKSFSTFKAWHYYSAGSTPDCFAIAQCNYFPDSATDPVVRLLTSLDLELPQDTVSENDCASIRRPLKKINSECKYSTLPTFLLQHPYIVLEMRLPVSPGLSPETESDIPKESQNQPLHWTVAIPTALLKPEFRKPVVQLPLKIGSAAEKFRVAEWVVRIPVARALWGDRLELPVGFFENKGVIEWTDGSKCLESEADWKEAAFENRIEARITVPRKALRYLPEELRLFRGSVHIASLGGLREAILPSKLKLEALSATQFALRGENAGVIDAVGLQEGQAPLLTTRGSGFVIVTLPAKDSKQKAQTTDSAIHSYAVLPLVDDGTKGYIPLNVTDDHNAPLLFTRIYPPEPEKAPKPPDETITITKTRNKPPKKDARGSAAATGNGSVSKK